MRGGKDGMKPQSTASRFRCFEVVDWRWVQKREDRKKKEDRKMRKMGGLGR